jgi:hypothetical protein
MGRNMEESKRSRRKEVDERGAEVEVKKGELEKAEGKKRN